MGSLFGCYMTGFKRYKNHSGCFLSIKSLLQRGLHGQVCATPSRNFPTMQRCWAETFSLLKNISVLAAGVKMLELPYLQPLNFAFYLEKRARFQEIHPFRSPTPSMATSGFEIKRKYRLRISVFLRFGPPPQRARLHFF